MKRAWGTSDVSKLINMDSYEYWGQETYVYTKFNLILGVGGERGLSHSK